MDLFSGGEGIVQGDIMIHEVDQGGNELAHLGFHKVRSCVELRGKIGQIRGDNLVKIPLLEGFVEGF